MPLCSEARVPAAVHAHHGHGHGLVEAIKGILRAAVEAVPEHGTCSPCLKLSKDARFSLEGF